MRRRQFLTAAGALLVSAQCARAQQDASPIVGILGSASLKDWTVRLRAFREGLAEGGFEEGRNVTVEYRWAEGRYERLPALASELVARRVSVLVVLGNTASALAARDASKSIPIVFRVAADPVELGLVRQMNDPGGNLTGVTTLGAESGPKQLAFLREVLPNASTIAALINPSNTELARVLLRALPAAAQALGLRLHVLSASSDADFDAAFAKLNEIGASGLVIGVDAFFNSRNERLAALALRHAIPAVSPYREFAEAGGLMSYGGSVADASRLAGVYTARVLKGDNPARLPVIQSARLELVLNLKTAREIHLAIPLTLQAQADEVIE